MYTHQEYMAVRLEEQPAAHRKYYGQFVDTYLKDTVARNFGIKRLVWAYKLDGHFNRIPLYEWDGYYSAFTILGGLPKRLKEAGDQWSLSSCVCIVKEAATQVVEEAIARGIGEVTWNDVIEEHYARRGGE